MSFFLRITKVPILHFLANGGETITAPSAVFSWKNMADWPTYSITTLMLREVLLLFWIVPSTPNSVIFMLKFLNCKKLMSKTMWNCKVITGRWNNIVFVREETTQRPHYVTSLLYVTGLTISVVVIWKLVWAASCFFQLTWKGADSEGEKYLTILSHLLWASSVQLARTNWAHISSLEHFFLLGCHGRALAHRIMSTVFPCLLCHQSRISVSTDNDLVSLIHIKIT